MITLKMNDERADTLRSVIGVLLDNQIQDKMKRKDLTWILKKLETEAQREPKKFCSYCFQTYHFKNIISKDATKCWSCGRSKEGNYLGKTEFWLTD